MRDLEELHIVYKILRIKFDQMIELFEKEKKKNTRIRIFILDITFIYNFIYGFFVKNRRIDLIFDEKYKDIHVIEILNLLAHYRRFFYSRLDCDQNYLFVFRSLNLKQNKSTYGEIYKIIEKFALYVPNLYVYDTMDKTLKYFYHFYKLRFFNELNPDIDFKTYILTTDNLLKSCIYSISNEHFTGEDLLIDGNYHAHKMYLNTFENNLYKYKELWENEDKLLRKKAKENFFKFSLLERFDRTQPYRIKHKNKLKIYSDLLNGNIEWDKILDPADYEFYLEFLILIQSDPTEAFKTLIDSLIENKKTDLFSKDLLHINNEYLKDKDYTLSIEWLFNYK